MWIDRDDRARLLDWSEPGSGRAPVDPEAVVPDFGAAQRCSMPPPSARCSAILLRPRSEPPTTPLPMPARKLLLSLRDGAFKTAAALTDAV